MLEQPLLPLDDQVRLAADTPPATAALPELERRPPQLVVLHAVALQPLREELAQVAERAALDDVVEQVVDALQLGLGHGDRQEPVVHGAARHDEHGEHLVRSGAKKPQLLEDEGLGPRRQDHGGGARELGEELAASRA